MSHFTCRNIGYGPQKDGFLREIRHVEQRTRVFSMLSPRQENPLPTYQTFKGLYSSPGIGPGLRNFEGAVQASAFYDEPDNPSVAAGAPAPALRFSVAAPNGEPSTASASPRASTAVSPRTATRQLLEEPTFSRNLPPLTTVAQRAFPPHDPEFVERFRYQGQSPFVKPKDDTTAFREKVYTIWNITGAKAPAGFRP